MLVRDATPADGRAIADVQVVSWRAAYDGLLEDKVLEELDPAVLALEWADGIAAPVTAEDRFWVIEDGARVVGYTRFGPSRDADRDPTVDAEIYGFYTHPEVWGSGGGALMFEGILEHLKARGFVDAFVWVAEGNERARRFYARRGFEHEPDIPSKDCFGTPEIRYHTTL